MPPTREKKRPYTGNPILQDIPQPTHTPWNDVWDTLLGILYSREETSRVFIIDPRGPAAREKPPKPGYEH